MNWTLNLTRTGPGCNDAGALPSKREVIMNHELLELCLTGRETEPPDTEAMEIIVDTPIDNTEPLAEFDLPEAESKDDRDSMPLLELIVLGTGFAVAGTGIIVPFVLILQHALST